MINAGDEPRSLVKAFGKKPTRRGLATAGLLIVLGTLCLGQSAPVVLSDKAVREAAKFHVEPEYPAAARQFRVSGEVIAEMTVGLDGKVESVTIAKGNPLLSASVVAALKKWTFAPFNVDGHPSRVKSTLTFAFKL